MQTSTITVSKTNFFITLQITASIVDLNHKELRLTLHIKKKLFPKTKRYLYDWCFTRSWISLNKTLLTQIITNYQNYWHKHFKTDSEPKPFIRRWALHERSAFATTRISNGQLHKRGICLGYSSLWCKNYSNLNYSLTKSSFHTIVFNEKNMQN